MNRLPRIAGDYLSSDDLLIAQNAPKSLPLVMRRNPHLSLVMACIDEIDIPNKRPYGCSTTTKYGTVILLPIDSTELNGTKLDGTKLDGTKLDSTKYKMIQDSKNGFVWTSTYWIVRNTETGHNELKCVID